MYSTVLKDLTEPLLDFQNLAKLLAKKWREYPIDRKKKDCRKVLDLLQEAVRGSGVSESPSSLPTSTHNSKPEDAEDSQVNGKDSPEFDWQKLGFESGDPANEINGMGFLGLLDFASFVQRDPDSFNKVSSFSL
jgi:engulfment and cell motility protein 1